MEPRRRKPTYVMALSVFLACCLSALLMLRRSGRVLPPEHEASKQTAGPDREKATTPALGAPTPSKTKDGAPNTLDTNQHDSSVASVPDPVSSSGAVSSSSDGRRSKETRAARPEGAMNCERGEGGFRCGPCSQSGDCPSGQACVVNVETRSTECASSECEEDGHCFPGTVCRVAERTATGVAVRRCLIAGEQGEGEGCVPTPFSARTACREGLLCIDGICGQRCAPGGEGCAPGFICRESSSGAVTGDGAGCAPDCSASGCTGALQCVAIKAGFRQCLRMMVDQCKTDEDCGPGHRCRAEWFGTKGGRYCAANCDSWRPNNCPAGFVCGASGTQGSSCYRECGGVNTCPTGFLCKTVTEDLQTWGCRVDYN
jgi:hypothetical protein